MQCVLQEYHAALCENLGALGYSQKLITLEELRAEYDSKSAMGMIKACTLLPVALTESDAGFNFEESLGDSTEIFFSETYKLALQRMLPMFEKQGVFQEL
jgi:hypothetical protein